MPTNRLAPMLPISIMFKENGKMAYTVPKFGFEEILKMTDDELFSNMKRLKRIVIKKKKAGQPTREAEVEICYLQAEAINRGHRF